MSEVNLNGVANEVVISAGSPGPVAEPLVTQVPPDRVELGRRAKTAHQERRRRNAIFADHKQLFGEPGWDMLLDLCIAYGCDRPIYISAATIGADAPLTTGLRYALALQEAGLAQRRSDPADKRRAFVELTPAGIALMTRYLSGE